LQHFAEVFGTRLQDAHDAADAAGSAGRRRRAAGKVPFPREWSCAFPSCRKVSVPQGESGCRWPRPQRLLATAENPVLIADRYARSEKGAKLLSNWPRRCSAQCRHQRPPQSSDSAIR
jgi:hypothetical protein